MSIQAFEGILPKIDDTAFVADSAYVSGDVAIGAQSSVWPTCVIRGDVHPIRIGQYSNIQDGSVLHVTHDSPFQPGGAALIIGDHITVGHRVILHACKIGDFCLIGMGSILLDNAVVEPHTIVGAGSLVSSGKVLSGGHLWLGSPVRKIRALSEQEMQFFEYSSNHYRDLKNRTIASLNAS